jgi:hypothetical protein
MTSILARIQARIDLLETWLALGIPMVGGEDGQEQTAYVPTSLTKARLWDDPDLGILKIADPNSFTTHHPKHGSKVVELENLLQQLKAAQARPKRPGKSLKAQLAALRSDHEALDKRHTKVVSQLAAALEEVEKERTQRLSVEGQLSDLRRKQRSEVQRAGKAALALVPTDDRSG